MKKIFGLLGVAIILIGVAFAQTVTEKNVDDLVRDVASTKGIEKEKIEGIKQVNFQDLPQEVNLKNIDETNLALYEINVENEDKPVYVITASSQLFTETIKKYAQRLFLTFGFSGEATSNSYLRTSVGVQTSQEKGYVMPRDGTITAITTNLEIIERESENPIEIVIHKNGNPVGFRNSFNSEEIGIYSDYDTISSGTIKFNKGDVISIEMIIPEGTQVKDITTLLEVETE